MGSEACERRPVGSAVVGGVVDAIRLKLLVQLWALVISTYPSSRLSRRLRSSGDIRRRCVIKCSILHPLDGGNWGFEDDVRGFERPYPEGDHLIHAPHPLLLSLLHLSPQQHAAIRIPPLLLPPPQLFLSFSSLHFHVQLWRARLMRCPRSFLDRSAHPFDPK